MDKKELESIVMLRNELIAKYQKLRDYKHNPNAIMKETEHAKALAETIEKIDLIIKDHVTFK